MVGSAGLSQGLAALQFWLLDFPQMSSIITPVNDGSDFYNNLDSLSKLIKVAEEICDCESSSPAPQPTSVLEAWACIHNLLNDCGISSEEFEEEDFDSRECQYIVLSTLLCHALSNNCKNQKLYVGRIMGWDHRPDVQQEIMTIVQENAHQGSSDTESCGETGDYSVLMNASLASTSIDLGYGIDISCQKRDRDEAFGEDDGGDNDTPVEKRHNTSVGDDDDDDDDTKEKEVTKQLFGSDDDQAIITKLKQELKESRQQEADLTVKVDEVQSLHRAEMLQLESKYLQQIRDMEDKYSHETHEQKKELEILRDRDQNITEMKEENLRLRDELDIFQCSKEKFTHTEEQLRKCREKIEAFGDVHDALQREEKAHAVLVDKCLEMENELAQLKPLKRQLEEYRVRATDAEVALAECRDDLRRFKEKSSGLEGANLALQRGVNLQQSEADALQKRLQEEGQRSGEGGSAVGVGMSELNPELMEELKMLRCEYARLKDFEAKREVDSVQRLEESCDDAKRLSERFKEQFLRTKSELEDTQQLLSESIAREKKLQGEVNDWSKKHEELGQEMKEEKLRAHQAALDTEKKYQHEKSTIIEQALSELNALEEKLTATIETERLQHKEKMDQAEAQRVEEETRLSSELVALQEQSSATLRTTKEQAQQRIEELEQSKQAEIERLTKAKEDEIEMLTNKGKAMIRESRAKAKALQKKISEEYEVEIDSLKQEREMMISIQEEYEKGASAKIAKRDQQIKLFDAKLQESTRANEELEESMKKTERSKRELMTDNDRLRRQLGSRFGPGSESEKQLEELMSVCNSLREENRRLKDNNPDCFSSMSSMPEASDVNDSSQNHHTSGISKNAFIQFREEFEERIKALETEKCSLIMRNSAATAETQKAEQRSWELEEEITKIRSELTTAKLALQRNQRRDEFPSGLSASSRKNYEGAEVLHKENSTNSTPSVHHRALPLSNSKNGDFTPKPFQQSSTKKSDQPSLMELTSKSSNTGTDEGAPECKQS
ncbi:hypothetical protein QTG54_001394 [Skeletonema marinoi]|uniref:Hook C-terminal domain-containing protein n=2 Tax=Skeletonema marinoi TaxID=267567 RepID=A0AAD9DGZ6_9STRA|nr:hypothetical protein QTG54_001394 [Skeletonema marinoi]